MRPLPLHGSRLDYYLNLLTTFSTLNSPNRSRIHSRASRPSRRPHRESKLNHRNHRHPISLSHDNTRIQRCQRFRQLTSRNVRNSPRPYNPRLIRINRHLQFNRHQSISLRNRPLKKRPHNSRHIRRQVNVNKLYRFRPQRISQRRLPKRPDYRNRQLTGSTNTSLSSHTDLLNNLRRINE